MVDEDRNKRIINKPDKEFEEVLFKANKFLTPLEEEVIDSIDITRDAKFIFICYPPRSGSTVIYQALAQTGLYSYVSNFVARFWDAPVFATLLQKKLKIENNYDQEFVSTYGVTEGLNDPHEFGFFWKKWLKTNNGTDRLLREERDRINKVNLIKTLNALASLDNKPLLIKNGLVSVNAGLFAELLPNSKFIIIKRNPIYIAQSIYEARNNLYGTAKEWWSIKPSTYSEIKELDVISQINRQIVDTYKDIENELSNYGERIVEVSYEEFCESPINIIENICEFIEVKATIEMKKRIPSSFKKGNSRRINKDIFTSINEYFSEYGE